jgi:hypothetical protein
MPVQASKRFNRVLHREPESSDRGHGLPKSANRVVMAAQQHRQYRAPLRTRFNSRGPCAQRHGVVTVTHTAVLPLASDSYGTFKAVGAPSGSYGGCHVTCGKEAKIHFRPSPSRSLAAEKSACILAARQQLPGGSRQLVPASQR